MHFTPPVTARTRKNSTGPRCKATNRADSRPWPAKAHACHKMATLHIASNQPWLSPETTSDEPITKPKRPATAQTRLKYRVYRSARAGSGRVTAQRGHHRGMAGGIPRTHFTSPFHDAM